uniref:Uncharacterized protein n=1 Tax=Nelumbo nucifera TaxID=4432 RepID=A0A822ZAS1_NELNU|nr:TPA_asm: hypothetical protein HUJ06_001604 [Nelumbo nucifera]
MTYTRIAKQEERREEERRKERKEKCYLNLIDPLLYYNN